MKRKILRPPTIIRIHLRKHVRMLCVAGLALVLPGCEEHRRLEDHMAVALGDPELRHPIRFSERRAVMDIEVPPDAEGLSQSQLVDVYRFLDRYKRESNERLVVSLSGSTRDRAALQRSLDDVQRLVIEAGIDDQKLRPQRHRPIARGIATIRLSYGRPVAVAPLCDHWPEDVGRNEERIPYPNWGCATQRNLAVMVDNGRDLIRPQAEDPRSSERRSVLWSAYATSNSGSGGDNGAAAAPKKGATPAAQQQ
jgi:pilus assembly protein CpaD